ncbi:MAG: hypothetical protein RI934_450, partial [Bacteroidota bacterium]
MKLNIKHLLLVAFFSFNSFAFANANEKLWNDANQNVAGQKYKS